MKLKIKGPLVEQASCKVEGDLLYVSIRTKTKWTTYHKMASSPAGTDKWDLYLVFNEDENCLFDEGSTLKFIPETEEEYEIIQNNQMFSFQEKDELYLIFCPIRKTPSF